MSLDVEIVVWGWGMTEHFVWVNIDGRRFDLINHLPVPSGFPTGHLRLGGLQPSP